MRCGGALLGVAVALLASTALAEDPACDAGRVLIVGELDEAWRTEAAHVCRDLPTFRDIDGTATVRVVAGDPVVVLVVVGDGRTTSRQVTSPSHLRATVEALVTLLPAHAPPMPPTIAPPTIAPTTVALPVVAPPVVAPPSTLPASGPSPPPTADLSVEVGASAMGRVAGTPTYLSVGPQLWCALEVSSWIFGLHGRWDAFQGMPSGPSGGLEMSSVGAGLDVARRFDVAEAVALDAGTSLRVIETFQSLEKAGDEVTGSKTDVTFALVGQLHVGGRGLRGSFLLEAEIAPLRVGRDTRIEASLPGLPAWSIGAGAGVSWRGG